MKKATKETIGEVIAVGLIFGLFILSLFIF
jgi:hypothetical protein